MKPTAEQRPISQVRIYIVRHQSVPLPLHTIDTVHNSTWRTLKSKNRPGCHLTCLIQQGVKQSSYKFTHCGGNISKTPIRLLLLAAEITIHTLHSSIDMSVDLPLELSSWLLVAL